MKYFLTAYFLGNICAKNYQKCDKVVVDTVQKVGLYVMVCRTVSYVCRNVVFFDQQIFHSITSRVLTLCCKCTRFASPSTFRSNSIARTRRLITRHTFKHASVIHMAGKDRVRHRFIHDDVLQGEPFLKRFALCCQTAVLSVCPVCLSVTLVYCGQTVGWIRMKLGMEVDLGPSHIVLDGDPAPLPLKGHSPLPFSCRLWSNGWMD